MKALCILCLCCLSFFMIMSDGATVPPTQQYKNVVNLIEASTQGDDPNLILYWNYDNDEITFELHSRNRPQTALPASFDTLFPGVALSNVSWTLFGFKNADASSALRADMIVAWVKPNGVGHFSDRRVLTNDNRIAKDADKTTNVFLLDAFVKDAYSVVKFKRMIDICHETNGEDLSLPQGDIELVFKHDYLYKSGDIFISPSPSSSDVLASLNTKKLTLMVNTGRPFVCPVPVREKPFGSEPTESYMFSAELLQSTYKLFWSFTDTEFIGEVHVRTKGWLSFGLSPNGAMSGSDVIVAWVNDDDGSTNFTDRHIVGRQVLVDAKQDWTLLSSKQSANFTVIKFKRPIKLCDSDDMTIEQGSPYVIYAFGQTDPPRGGDVGYHGSTNRGTRAINLISMPKTRDVGVSNLETFDLNIESVTAFFNISMKK